MPLSYIPSLPVIPKCSCLSPLASHTYCPPTISFIMATLTAAYSALTSLWNTTLTAKCLLESRWCWFTAPLSNFVMFGKFLDSPNKGFLLYKMVMIIAISQISH